MAVKRPLTTTLTEQETKYEIMKFLRSFNKDAEFKREELE